MFQRGLRDAAVEQFQYIFVRWKALGEYFPAQQILKSMVKVKNTILRIARARIHEIGLETQVD